MSIKAQSITVKDINPGVRIHFHVTWGAGAKSEETTRFGNGDSRTISLDGKNIPVGANVEAVVTPVGTPNRHVTSAPVVYDPEGCNALIDYDNRSLSQPKCA